MLLFCLVILTNPLSLIIFQKSLVSLNTHFYRLLVIFFEVMFIVIRIYICYF